MNTGVTTHPFLSDQAASRWEAAQFAGGGDPWKAMWRAGEGLARQLSGDLELVRTPTQQAPLTCLALLGKGNNAADAVLALRNLHLCGIPLRIRAVFALGHDDLKPLLRRALDACTDAAVPMEIFDWKDTPSIFNQQVWDFSLDGIFGLSFRAPVYPGAASLIRAVNAYGGIALRAAVDYPSGLSETTLADPEAPVLRADFTYQTGIPKKALLHPSRAKVVGRLRYVDIGFFENNPLPEETQRVVVRQSVLRELTALRPALSDKRVFGHCCVLSGSRAMAGAHLMNVQGALVSGAGLVSAFAPPEHASAFCARAPSALWNAYPDNGEGGASLEGADAFLEKCLRANAVLLGSGMGRSKDTQALIARVVREAACPLVLDADALTESTLEALAARPADAGACVLTPHLGEYARLNPFGQYGDENEFCRKFNVLTVLKSHRTAVYDGETVYINLRGSPALARGGSGDVLAGLLTGLLAQWPQEPLKASLCAVIWHALASESAERAFGQRAATTDRLIDALPEALRNKENNCNYHNIL